jgi:hypothetical protein
VPLTRAIRVVFHRAAIRRPILAEFPELIEYPTKSGKVFVLTVAFCAIVSRGLSSLLWAGRDMSRDTCSL